MAWAFLSLAGHFPRFIDSRNLWWVDLRGKLITQIHHCTWEDQISSISRKVCDACADTHIVRLSNLGNLLWFVYRLFTPVYVWIWWAEMPSVVWSSHEPLPPKSHEHASLWKLRKSTSSRPLGVWKESLYGLFKVKGVRWIIRREKWWEQWDSCHKIRFLLER